jgi:hypothetical protein
MRSLVRRIRVRNDFLCLLFSKHGQYCRFDPINLVFACTHDSPRKTHTRLFTQESSVYLCRILRSISRQQDNYGSHPSMGCFLVPSFGIWHLAFALYEMSSDGPSSARSMEAPSFGANMLMKGLAYLETPSSVNHSLGTRGHRNVSSKMDDNDHENARTTTGLQLYTTVAILKSS